MYELVVKVGVVGGVEDELLGHVEADALENEGAQHR